MIRFITAAEHITLSPLDITGVFVKRVGPCFDFTKTKPFKHYAVSIETSDKVYDFEYQILSNFFEKFEDEFCNGIVEDINEFIVEYARVFQEHKPQGCVKLDVDDVVYRNLNDTNIAQITAITNTSIIIEGIQELDNDEESDNPEYTDDEDDDYDDDFCHFERGRRYVIDDDYEFDDYEFDDYDFDDEFEDVESQPNDICMCPDCEAEFERQIAPYIKKVISDMKSKKEI